MIIIEIIFAFGFMVFYVSFKIGQVDFTFGRVAPTDETKQIASLEGPSYNSQIGRETRIHYISKCQPRGKAFTWASVAL